MTSRIPWRYARSITNQSRGIQRASAIPGSNLSDAVQQEIQRETSLPTPDPARDSATAALVDDQMHYLVPTYVRPAPMFVKGEGCHLWDLENRRYLDFTAGIAVCSLGHCDPEISRLLANQSRILVHTSNLYHTPWVGSLSKLLVSHTVRAGGMPSAAKAFICNSGTEANEAALKFARKIGKALVPDGSKHEIVSFDHSFHGRTWGSLSATPNPKYQTPFAPMIPGFRNGRFNELDGLDDLITHRTCGVIVEPIQGEGGINLATSEFLSALRRRCDAVGALLIYDEIQSGLSRTGHLWAHQCHRHHRHHHHHHRSEDGLAGQPDILTSAKALGNGFPIGATIVSDFVAHRILVGDHGTTFGGNPLGCRLAHHVFSRLADPVLQSSVVDRGRRLRWHLIALAQRFPQLVSSTVSSSSFSFSSPPLHDHNSDEATVNQGSEVGAPGHEQVIRGLGLIQGLRLRIDPAPLITAARERGLLIISCGTNTLRFLPPLIIDDALIDEGAHILAEAMESLLP